MSEYVDLSLDLLGKVQFSLYTQVCLAFPMFEGVNQDNVVARLNAGLERLVASFPWMNGNMVYLDQSDGSGSIAAIRLRDDKPRVVVKDMRGSDTSLPSMSELRSRDFAMCQLPEDFICPEKTIPVPESQLPVFIIQATFIEGGLLMTFTGHHAAMDMTGLAVCIRLFNKACRGEPFTEIELAAGKMARENVIPVFDSDWQPDDKWSSRIMDKPQGPPIRHATKTDETDEPALLEWATFAFSSEALARLKAEAMKDVPKDSFVSTDDVLSIHLYQTMTAARMRRLPEGSTITLARNVDSRRQLGIPEEYPGMVVTRTYITHDLASIGAAHSLGIFASELRAASADAKDYLRVLATIVARSKGNSTLKAPKLDSKIDVNSSSWAKYGELWSMDLGIGLGIPEAVQRPAFPPEFESLVYVLPKKLDGSIGVVMCIRHDDVENLRSMSSWTDYARYVG